MPHISLIEDLTTGPISPGSTLLVEFDPASQWYNASLTITTEWLKQGGTAWYHDYMAPPDSIRSKLKQMGLDVEDLERNERLQIWDWYTCQLGQKSREKYAHDSLKVADLSIEFSRVEMRRSMPGVLYISDNTSAPARFNDERVYVEYVLTRVIPSYTMNQSIGLRGLLKGVHNEWVYKQLEAAHAGVIDFTVEQVSGEWKNFITLRSMRDVGHDSRPHQLKVAENLQVTFEKQ
jgi:KaiC/GvpD/RAD55 family RecA-like ATPase